MDNSRSLSLKCQEVKVDNMITVVLHLFRMTFQKGNWLVFQSVYHVHRYFLSLE